VHVRKQKVHVQVVLIMLQVQVAAFTFTNKIKEIIVNNIILRFFINYPLLLINILFLFVFSM